MKASKVGKENNQQQHTHAHKHPPVFEGQKCYYSMDHDPWCPGPTPGLKKPMASMILFLGHVTFVPGIKEASNTNVTWLLKGQQRL